MRILQNIIFQRIAPLSALAAQTVS